MSYLPFPEYQKVRATNWSLLKHMAKSPADFRYAETHEQADSAAMQFGRAVHTLTLEFDRFALEYAVWEGGRRGTKAYAAWCEQNCARQEIGVTDYMDALAVRNAVHAHPVAGPLLQRKGETESVIEWTDEETGIECKARPDFIATDERPLIVDLKTTPDIDAFAFSRNVVRFKYVSQLGMYRDGVKAALGLDCGAVIIAVEKTAPFDVAVFRITPDDLWKGSDEAHELLTRLKTCRETDEWPGRYPERVDLDVPPWAFGEDATDDQIHILEG